MMDGTVKAEDPTSNVLQLVDATIKRQDDLRNLEARHVRELIHVRAVYDEKLRAAETARIDAIRTVDVGAVQRAAEVSATQASTLAAQVATSAETLRTQVATTQTANTQGLAAALEPIKNDIADLRKTQYEQAGIRATVVENKTDSRSDKSLLWAIILGLSSLFLVILFGVIGIVLTLMIR